MAVAKIAGKQFVVEEGKTITVPFLDLEIGQSLKTKDLITGKDLEFEVVDQKRSGKTIVLKFRNKTRYQRLIGQRTKLTVVKSVKAKSEKVEKKETEKPAAKKSSAKKD